MPEYPTDSTQQLVLKSIGPHAYEQIQSLLHPLTSTRNYETMWTAARAHVVERLKETQNAHDTATHPDDQRKSLAALMAYEELKLLMQKLEQEHLKNSG